MFLALAAYITNPLTYTPPYNGAREGSIPISNRLQKLGHPSTASANAFRLIQFYISLLRPDGLLKSKVFQNRLTKAAAVRVAWYVGRAWEGCEDMMNGSRKLVDCSKSDLQQARDDLVDVSPSLLSIIAQNSLRSIDGGRRLRRSAAALIRACVDRERSTKEAWAAPDGFEESLQAVLSLVSNSKVDDSKEAEGWDDVPEEYWGEEAEAAPSPESSERSLKEIENLIRSLLDAKGTEDDQEGETKEQEKNGMDVDAPTAPASVSQANAPVATPTQPKQTSKTTLDVINERRREFEREHERQKASKPFAAQGVNSEQRRSLPQTSSLSVRGAASLGLASKTSPAVDVDMKDNVAPRSTPSVSSDHARASHGDTRPSKRTKSFPSPFSNEISFSTPSRPVGETMSRTPSLLARLQSSSESVVEVGGGSVASPGSLASRLLSPSLSSSKSAPQKVSATALDTQNVASRGHRPISGTAASTMSLAIKGQASSLEKLAAGPRGYSAAPPTSTEGVTEFRIRGAALRGDDDSGGRLSLLDRLRDTSIVGEGDSKSKKRKR
ncbi:hypothetical protein SCHPADRAFT_232583 [Schizopora paradoxa]|uniref:Uncharacterized protein n=1 Tax=Schizopora paradoxa TaxID=27342 RepID=A0A0H2RWP5_9AGAM|nr:hypothetical protein SCHPADRAFT_232583 [Schizopora paradoxa]